MDSFRAQSRQQCVRGKPSEFVAGPALHKIRHRSAVNHCGYVLHIEVEVGRDYDSGHGRFGRFETSKDLKACTT